MTCEEQLFYMSSPTAMMPLFLGNAYRIDVPFWLVGLFLKSPP